MNQYGNLILKNKIVLSVLFLASCLSYTANAQQYLEITSSAFDHNTDIPIRYSAYGENISPDLSWNNLPQGTRQLALILEDPIVAMPQPFVHWVAYNIPATSRGLPSGLTTDTEVTGHISLAGMINGLNGTGRPGYFGPRPPVDGKVHKYHFTIYALGTELMLPHGLDKASLLDAMEGHVLATSTLTGNFQQFD